jgi:hypothetical protein
MRVQQPATHFRVIRARCGLVNDTAAAAADDDEHTAVDGSRPPQRN